MHFHTITPHPFRRNAVERRSLRYHNRLPRTASSKFKKRRENNIFNCYVSIFLLEMHPCVPRTSLDLELDLKAQQTKLENLHDEITRLRDLKQR
jgi:protein KIBRA